MVIAEIIIMNFVVAKKKENLGMKNMENNLLAANNILKEGRRSLGDITNAEAEVTKPVKRLELSVIN